MKGTLPDIPALYHPEPLVPDTIAVLHDEEIRHLRALRLRTGDSVMLLDGRGRRAEGVVHRIENRNAEVRITGSVLDEARTRPYIALAIGLLADKARFEWLVEKSVELGVAELRPLQTARSEGHYHAERTRRIAIAALKQSRRAFLPELHGPSSFDSLLNDGGLFHPIFLCHEKASPEDSLASLASAHRSESPDGESSPTRILLMIGPEGGFSEAEVEQATSASARIVSLGTTRLRAETAAITSLVLTTYLMSDPVRPQA